MIQIMGPGKKGMRGLYERLFREVMKKPSQGHAKRLIVKALSRLSDRDIEILTDYLTCMKYGFPISTAAEELNVSVKHMKRLQARAKARLRELMRPCTEAEQQITKTDKEQYIVKQGINMLNLESAEKVTAEEERWLLKHHRLISRGISELRRRLNEHVAVARAVAASRK